MRIALLLVLVACKPGGVSSAQEVCAKAGAMFEKCEDFGSAAPLEHDMMIDRWRGLCRAVFTGETKQLMPNALQLYQSLDDGERAGLKIQAECTAKAVTCDQYRACEK
ncbi:MAG: hypothetical protein JO257_25000 [Deltaproteobacteria bacterium]|nr:hypothetical protein [Deltaproteobacteria bacterium]